MKSTLLICALLSATCLHSQKSWDTTKLLKQVGMEFSTEAGALFSNSDFSHLDEFEKFAVKRINNGGYFQPFKMSYIIPKVNLGIGLSFIGCNGTKSTFDEIQIDIDRTNYYVKELPFDNERYINSNDHFFGQIHLNYRLYWEKFYVEPLFSIGTIKRSMSYYSYTLKEKNGHDYIEVYKGPRENDNGYRSRIIAYGLGFGYKFDRLFSVRFSVNSYSFSSEYEYIETKTSAIYNTVDEKVFLLKQDNNWLNYGLAFVVHL